MFKETWNEPRTEGVFMGPIVWGPGIFVLLSFSRVNVRRYLLMFFNKSFRKRAPSLDTFLGLLINPRFFGSVFSFQMLSLHRRRR